MLISRYNSLSTCWKEKEKMAIIQSFTGLDMFNINFSDLANGDSYTGNSVSFEVDYANGAAQLFKGFGFSYNGNTPVSGTVTEFVTGTWSPPTVGSSVTGLNIPMTSIVAASLTTDLYDDAFILGKALAFRDTITGSPFSDRLFGGGGNDVLRGKGGADSFVYIGGDGRDTIKDFKHSQHDKIDLSPIDAKPGVFGDQRFKFIDDESFHHKSGEVRFADHKVLADIDGDGHADLQIKLSNVDNLHGNDLFL
jgi:Ca2+-binding RTX toxin-like protein